VLKLRELVFAGSGLLISDTFLFLSMTEIKGDGSLKSTVACRFIN
jgi:hypothetical protein